MNIFEERRQKVYRALKKDGIEKAVFGDPRSINYMTGTKITPYERFYGLVLDPKTQKSVMVNPCLDSGCMKGTMEEYTYSDIDGPIHTMRRILNGTREIAIDTQYFPIVVGNMFDNLGCSYRGIGDIIARLRMIKDKKEISLIQRAASIVDEALEYVSGQIKPGMTENELKMMLYTYMAQVPGFITDEFIILVLAGANSANPHGISSDYSFKEGDIVLIDFCAYYMHYWSDITRCLFIEHIGNSRLAEIYNIVHEANLAAIGAVRPGVKASEIDNTARNYITNAGFGEFFLHRTGHGLGLSVHEEPYITNDNNLILEEGMIFTIEPGIYIKELGGVRIEDDVLVTKDGCSILTKTSKNLNNSIIRIK